MHLYMRGHTTIAVIYCNLLMYLAESTQSLVSVCTSRTHCSHHTPPQAKCYTKKMVHKHPKDGRKKYHAVAGTLSQTT